MVLLEGKKYSCETCIKGHRSSNCKHTDRPLFEIQKKGRPPTQCAHCRTLRKTRQVHVKCMCASTGTKEEKKGSDKMLETPAFPNGLGASLVASSQASDETHSDSSHPELGCRCDDDGQCACCIPRKSAPRTRKPKGVGISDKPVNRLSPESDSSASSIAAQGPALRPLAPRSATSEEMPHVGYHGHDRGFTPYGRAYESAHPHQTAMESNQGFLSSSSVPFVLQPPSPIQSTPVLNGSFCACGHTCRCAGCGQAEHDGAEPPHCGSCLQCTLISEGGGDSLFAPPPPAEYSLDIDDWIQQMGASGYMEANEDVNAVQSYDWSALDTSDVMHDGNCCGGGDQGTSSEEGLTVPELTRSRSPSDSSSAGAGWSGDKALGFYGLQPYFEFGNAQSGDTGYAEEMEPSVPYTSYV